MFNNNKFSQKHLEDVLLRPELLLPPATPEFPDLYNIEIPTQTEKEQKQQADIDNNINKQTTETNDKERIHTFGGLLKTVKFNLIQLYT
jgi:hypothetical protein